jgi:hypothetical protein
MAQKLSKQGRARKAARDKKYAMTPNRRKKTKENVELQRKKVETLRVKITIIKQKDSHL